MCQGRDGLAGCPAGPHDSPSMGRCHSSIFYGGSERLSDLPGGGQQIRVLPRSSRPLDSSAPYAYEGRKGTSLYPVLNVSTDSHAVDA